MNKANMHSPTITQKELRHAVEMAIHLINMVEDNTITDSTILESISSNNYLALAQEVDTIFRPQNIPTLASLIKNIIEVLSNGKMRYDCGFLSIENYIFQVIDTLDMDAKEMYELVKACHYDIFKGHLLKKIVQWCADKQQIDEAVFYTEKMPTITTIGTEDQRNRGYRIITAYYAGRGDLTGFRKYLKKSDTRRDRYQIINIKAILVKNYTEKLSLSEAIEFVTQTKELGIGYLYDALQHWYPLLAITKLEVLFVEYPVLQQAEPGLPHRIYTTAFVKNPGNLDIENFEIVFEKVDTMDKKINGGMCSMRDGLLMEIALYLAGQDKSKYLQQIKRCSKAIKNASIKREIKYALEH